MILLAGMFASGHAAAANAVTYHYDNLRTGWDDQETVLTPALVAGSFGLQQQVELDDRVDAQPLLVTGLTIAGGTHDVVYVATEGDSVYAIDAESGAILIHASLGSPVPASANPCKPIDNGPNLGILSTPVIDLALQTLYVMAYAYDGGSSAGNFYLHALDLTTLTNRVPPVLVTASRTLPNGTTYAFRGNWTRQRPALLDANGNIYVGFGSLDDCGFKVSRGWLLGWTNSVLSPLPANRLMNQELPSTAGSGAGVSPDDFYLSSIWMSGFGLAAGPTGNIFFATGNSDPSGTTYNPPLNLEQSVVAVSADLSTLASYFTPADTGANVAVLDQQDLDFGSGGVMLIPSQPGAPLLAVAAGKAGRLYLMNRSSLGGYGTGPGGSNNVLDEERIGDCWCGPSYFRGPDGIGRVVTSGGAKAIVWKIQTSPAVKLVQELATAPFPPTVQDGGFFTTVSSNGTAAGTAVIWAVGRPTSAASPQLLLYAFDAATGATLYAAPAGSWTDLAGDAFVVPLVANGRVYVASDQSLAIFGTGAGASPAGVTTPASRPATASAATTLEPHQLSGRVLARAGGSLVLETRSGARVTVDTSEAVRHDTAVPPVVGRAVVVRGDYEVSGVFQAEGVLYAKAAPETWPPDR